MDQAERDTVRLWRAHKTVHHMVHDRGYVISQAELDMALPEFTRTFGSGGVVKKDDPSDQLFIFFPEDTTVGVKPIRTFCEKMVEQSVYKAIIVCKGTMTSSAEKVMQQMAPKYIMEYFKENELLVNITEHQLVPPHILLQQDEKQQLLEKYRLKETQLPRILSTDPVSRYYGFRKGQVVKIIRNSETAGRYVTYRLVV